MTLAASPGHRPALGGAAVDPPVSERRRDLLVLAVVALAYPVLLFATLIVVGTYAGNYVPGVDAPPSAFVPFYSNNFTRIRLTVTLELVGVAVLLALVVGLVRLVSRRLDLVGWLAIVFASAGAAVAAGGRALFASPTLVPEMTADKLPADLDPSVARFVISAGDVAGAAAGVLLGLSLIGLAWLWWSSDVVAPRALAVASALVGLVGVLGPLLGGNAVSPLLVPWAIAVGIALLATRSRRDAGGVAAHS